MSFTSRSRNFRRTDARFNRRRAGCRTVRAQKVFRRQRSLDRREAVRRYGQEEFREVADAARVGERQRALQNPEVPLNEPDDAAEVLRRIADKPVGRVAGHHDQRHTEFPLVATLSVSFDRRAFMIVPAAPIVPSDNIAVRPQYALPSRFLHGLVPTALTGRRISDVQAVVRVECVRDHPGDAAQIAVG